MVAVKNISKVSTEEDQHEQWFSSFIKSINETIASDKKKLETGNASTETIAFYKSLIDGDFMKTISMTRSSTSSVIIKKMVLYYLNLLSEKKIELSKLAIDTSPNKILVWAEIKENDEKTEMDLISVESVINGIFSNDTGIYLDSIIIEDCDKLAVPSHYSLVSLK